MVPSIAEADPSTSVINQENSLKTYPQANLKEATLELRPLLLKIMTNVSHHTPACLGKGLLTTCHVPEFPLGGYS